MKRYSLIALLTLTALACTNELNDPAKDPSLDNSGQENILTSKVTGEKFSAYSVNIGRLAVKFSEDYTALIEESNADVRALSASTKSSDNPLSLISGKSLERIFPYDEKYEGRTRREGLHRWYYVDLSESQDFLEAEELLANCSEVEIVELDRKIMRADPGEVVSLSLGTPARRSGELPFNDPKLGDQWHYYNDGSMSGSIEGSDINVFPAWRNYPKGELDVVVGIVDGLVDTTHEDLVDNLWTDEDGSHGKSFVFGNHGYFDSHGTHVAGTVAAVNNNGVGVCGVAGGDKANGIPGAKIMTCGIFEGDFSGDGAEAIKWSCDKGANISQNSWGYIADTNGDGIVSNSELASFKTIKIPSTLKAAVDYFNNYAGCDDDGNQLPDSPMKGGVVIFAAGNETIDYDPIGNYEGVISVAAIGADFRPSYYSNYGTWVDITATGGDYYKSAQVLSTIPNNGYGYMQGTSMACPHVSGVAALIASTYQGQGFTREDLIQILLGSANKSLYDYNSDMEGKLGKGLVNAAAALSFSTEAPAPVEGFRAEAASNSINVSWDVPADFPVFGYRLFASESSLADLDPSAPGNAVDVLVIDGVDCTPGKSMVYTLSGLKFNQEYHFRIAAVNYKGMFSELSGERTVTTPANNPPVIEALDGTSFTIKPFENPEIKFKVSDPDGHNLSITLTPANPAASLKISGETVTVAISGTKLTQGSSYDFCLSASDGFDAVSKNFSVTVLENHAPVLIKAVDNVVMNGLDTSIDINLAEYFQDEDGEPLSYVITKSGSTTIFQYSILGNKLTLNGFAYGSSTLTLTATDACGKTAYSSFKLLVRDAAYPVDLYPNPVVDVLNIRTPEEVMTKVMISNKAGATVYENAEVGVGPFNPLSVDMSALPSGIYYVKIDGQEEVFSVVKK